LSKYYLIENAKILHDPRGRQLSLFVLHKGSLAARCALCVAVWPQGRTDRSTAGERGNVKQDAEKAGARATGQQRQVAAVRI